MIRPTLRCDLFCTVIDNYGDLGVCWRLARHLADDHAVAVTLWIDDLTSFQRLASDIDPAQSSQMLGNICIRHWQDGAVEATPGDLVIEGFACSLPPDYILAMAARRSAPVWINLGASQHRSDKALLVPWLQRRQRWLATHSR